MKLHDMRLKRGLSQSQLADKSGINVRTLQAYEQGLKNIDGAKLKTLINLSLALDCKISEIVTNEELKNLCGIARL